MPPIYLDNASTAYPKAPPVADAVRDYILNTGCNVGRGEYAQAYSAAEMVFETRERLCDLFHFDSPKNVIFTMNITQSLNFLLKGLLHSGDHVLVSAMEHNAVMRPLTQLADSGVSFTRMPCNRQGELLTGDLDSLVQPNTKAMVLLHASNVCGTLMPLEAVGAFCQKHRLLFLADAAQTAGVFPIDMKALHLDALAFTGHKSLLGPQGVGGFVLTDALARQVTPLISGGTGSISDQETVPAFLPDRFEPGTMNLPGIAGLHAALGYLKEIGIDAIRAHEQSLSRLLQEGLTQLPGVRLLGVSDPFKRAPVVSVDFPGYDNAQIAYLLDSSFQVMTRCGLHCAPNAHKVLGTFPQGTVRFSVGFMNTQAQVLYAVDAVAKALKMAQPLRLPVKKDL
ncbi:MAG: aminotransferase class V-fold PLP-dependent enzyme [Oscillospiraceae bacterium]|nr:aminotransferase class V-fold PLP-dependent enzyme [Oscillospiraceae bacterium]